MINLDSDILSANVSIFELYVHEEDYNLSGMLINRHYNFLIAFKGVRQMFDSLEGLFNHLNFPMAAREERHFTKDAAERYTQPNTYNLAPGEYEGEEPDFILHVQFRQGSTWQGTLRWVEKEITKRFRSELELISLLMEALEMKGIDSGGINADDDNI